MKVDGLQENQHQFLLRTENRRSSSQTRTILPELEYMYSAPVPTVANIAAHAHNGAIPVAATLRACQAVGLTGLFMPGMVMVGCQASKVVSFEATEGDLKQGKATGRWWEEREPVGAGDAPWGQRCRDTE